MMDGGAMTPADHAVVDLASAWTGLSLADERFQHQAVSKLTAAYRIFRDLGAHAADLRAPREVVKGTLNFVSAWLDASPEVRDGKLRTAAAAAIDSLVSFQAGTAEEPYVR